MARKEMVDDMATYGTEKELSVKDNDENIKEVVRVVTIEEILNIINQKIDYLHELILKKD